MIKEKDFESLDSLNEFIQENIINIINVETILKDYYTNFPLPKGGRFVYKKEYKRLIYESN